MIDNINKAFEYACDKYYSVIYDRDHCGHEQRAEGLLLNYASGNIVLLSDKGMYHIKYNDVIFMRPIEPRMDKLSEEFKELLKSFRNNGRPSVKEAMYDWAESYFKGAGDFMKYLVEHSNVISIIHPSELECALVKFAEQYGEVKEIN